MNKREIPLKRRIAEQRTGRVKAISLEESINRQKENASTNEGTSAQAQVPPALDKQGPRTLAHNIHNAQDRGLQETAGQATSGNQETQSSTETQRSNAAKEEHGHKAGLKSEQVLSGDDKWANFKVEGLPSEEEIEAMIARLEKHPSVKGFDGGRKTAQLRLKDDKEQVELLLRDASDDEEGDDDIEDEEGDEGESENEEEDVSGIVAKMKAYGIGSS